jgi:hypothetical protein
MPDPTNKEIHDAILAVLVRDWDPFRLKCDTIAGSQYELYVAPIYQILTGTRSEKELADYLHTIKKKDFAILDPGRSRNRKAARKLLEIKIDGGSPGC